MHAEGRRGRQVKKRTCLVLAKNGAEEGGPNPGQLRLILESAGDGGLRFHPVSRRVGSPLEDDSRLLEEQAEDEISSPTDEPGLFGPVVD